MELRHLRYFQAVAEELSFSRAARRLRIVQPALSRAIKELEEDLDARLLDRNRRTVKLTPAGAVLLHETGLLLQRLEESLRRVRRTASGEEGELVLGYIGPPTQTFLGLLLKEYRRLYPKVSVHLEERTPERVWEMVARGRLSAGLTRPVLSPEARGLHTMRVNNEPLCAAMPARHKLAKQKTLQWKLLAKEPLIVLARREGVGLHDAILEGCHEAGFEPRVMHWPSLIGTVMSYVEAGEGIGIVPGSVALGKNPGVKFVPLRPGRTVPLVFVWSDASDDPPVKAFRELLRKGLAEGWLHVPGEP
jgi:DNA-binding transcriptional LysR family regulator